jgi:hypothetical protein
MKPTLDFIADPEDGEKDFNFSIVDMVQKNENDGVVKEEQPKRKRGPGRPPNNSSTVNTYTNENRGSKETLDKKYEKGYIDNAKLLYSAIAQTESMYNNIDDELSKFRENKSYGGRNRIMYMSNYMNTQVGLINTKITAVRELNSVRNKINDLVLKKEQMMKDTNEENSDKSIMDAYYALVNAPRYGLPSVKQNLPPASINTGSFSTSVVRGPMVQSEEDISFQEYQNNLTPVQKKMIADKDPNIKTVVVYDQTSGNKWFDVIDVTTGKSIPGIQRPAEFLLDNMRIDIRNGLGVNSNTNMTFPLVLLGTQAIDEL